MLDILESICSRLESGRSVEPGDLEVILGVIGSFVGPHQVLGEDLVLSAVDEAGVSIEGGALLVMMTERNELLKHVRNLRAAVDKYREGDRRAAEDIIQTGRSYINILRRQMKIEEEDIYPRLDIHLSPRQQRELLARLEESGSHRKYEALQKLAEMKDRYLSNG
jgi:hemerythrin-like domain-containing protein